jgi:WD40 repeat protein
MTVPEFEVEIPFEPPHYDTVTSIKRMGDSFLSASRDKNIKRWDADGNETHNIMNAHQDWINALETDAEESHLYSAAKDGKIRIWRVKNVLECSCELALHQSSVNCLARI